MGKISPDSVKSSRTRVNIGIDDRTMESEIELELRATARRRRRRMRRWKWLMVLGIAGCLGWAAGRRPGRPRPRPRPMSASSGRSSRSGRRGRSPGRRPEPNADGWNALFDALLDDLQAYGQAQDEADRLTALDRIYEISAALGTVAWPPAATVAGGAEGMAAAAGPPGLGPPPAERDRDVPAAGDRSGRRRPTGRDGSTSSRTTWARRCATTTPPGRCSSGRRRCGGSTRPSRRSTGRTRGSRARGGPGSRRGSSRPR